MRPSTRLFTLRDAGSDYAAYRPAAAIAADPPHELLHRFGEDDTGHIRHFVECEVTLEQPE